MFNFLALLDIRVFGRLYLWLLIGLALFLQPGCFCLALKTTGVSLPMSVVLLKIHFLKDQEAVQMCKWLCMKNT